MAYPVIAGRVAMYNAERARCAGGTLEILSAANQVLAVFPLDGTAGTVVAAGEVAEWVLGFDEAETTGEAVAGAGTNMTTARIKNAGGQIEFVGFTVSLPAGSGDLKFINVSVTAGQPVSIASAVIRWPNPGA